MRLISLNDVCTSPFLSIVRHSVDSDKTRSVRSFIGGMLNVILARSSPVNRAFH